MGSPSVTELWGNSHSGFMSCPVSSVALLVKNSQLNGGHHSFGKEAIKKKSGQTKTLSQPGPTGVLRRDRKYMTSLVGLDCTWMV